MPAPEPRDAAPAERLVAAHRQFLAFLERRVGDRALKGTIRSRRSEA